ncbi:MAG: cytochrome c [Deltaproteobacteria bacterium]|nr:cytochrome c [Deltaproteobacteria bacterium]
MKNFVFFLLMAMMLSACALKNERLENQADAWKPGLGEIMGVIQQHHAKLYYSANARNWALAEYQVGEIQEGLETAVRLYPQFKEVKGLSVLIPAATKEDMENLSQAVKKKNLDDFLAAYNKLTNSCNACHNEANRGFIVIQAPTSLEFSNQKFEP